MRSLLVAALLLSSAACGDDGSSTDEGRWQLLSSDRASSLLAVWASGLDNVWAVGAREGAGGAPTVLHYDGTAWTKLDTGMPNVDLWSVFGFDNEVFFGGSNGTILRYRNGAFEKLTTPAADITFGLWGSSPTDVWAVGGQTAGRGFIWRFNGTAFEAVAGLPTEIAEGTVWKVTGRAADDVWFSATRGTVLHWNGAALSSEAIGATGESLFSIGCRSDGCVTAGTNTANGVLYEYNGSAWASNVPTNDGPPWRGMTPTGEHQYVVGMVGAVLRRDGSRWVADAHGLTTEALHAAWSDADGNLFAVGGKFDRSMPIDGVLLYKGTAELPAPP